MKPPTTPIGLELATLFARSRHDLVLVALDEMGRRVPDDVAVTGYDNWRVFALETEPQLKAVFPIMCDKTSCSGVP